MNAELLMTGLGAHSFGDMKIWIVAITGLSRDALHIHVGMGLYLAARLLLRGSGHSAWALALVLTVALTAEVLDHIYEMSRMMRCDLADHLQDLVNTSLWPVILTVIENRAGKQQHLAPPKQGQIK